MAQSLRHSTHNQKMTPIQLSGIQRASKISNVVSHYSKSVSRKSTKCFDFVLVQVTRIVQKWHNL